MGTFSFGTTKGAVGGRRIENAEAAVDAPPPGAQEEEPLLYW
jgi:hypothetical protein